MNQIIEQVVSLSLCQIEETEVDGGGIAIYHHLKPNFLLFAHSKEDAKAVH